MPPPPERGKGAGEDRPGDPNKKVCSTRPEKKSREEGWVTVEGKGKSKAPKPGSVPGPGPTSNLNPPPPVSDKVVRPTEGPVPTSNKFAVLDPTGANAPDGVPNEGMDIGVGDGLC